MFKHKNKEQKVQNQSDTDININKMASTMGNLNKQTVPSDVLGSYTGIAKDGDEPTQDGDDL
jgi:hypothetical protein